MSNQTLVIKAKVGPLEDANDNERHPIRMDRTGAVVVTHAHGRRAELALHSELSIVGITAIDVG